jgi:hypothetical protein
VSKASGSMGDAMGDAHEEFWAILPEKVEHPIRVPIIEALWWIGEPLSAIALVDLFDGFLSMWEAAHHLNILEELDVVEPSPVETASRTSRNDRFDVPYRLKDRDVCGDNADGADHRG